MEFLSFVKSIMPTVVVKFRYPLYYRKDGLNHHWSNMPFNEDGTAQAMSDCCWVNGENNDYEASKRLAKLWMVESRL
jgi:hypothetical protein